MEDVGVIRPHLISKTHYLIAQTARIRRHAFFSSSKLESRNVKDASTSTKTTNTLISVTELKQMLVVIVDHQLSVCFRFRILGEMWHPTFMRVIRVTDRGVLLNDDVNNKMHHIVDLSHVVQFEIDQRLHNFHPHFHYELTPYN